MFHRAGLVAESHLFSYRDDLDASARLQYQLLMALVSTRVPCNQAKMMIGKAIRPT
ncbi:hypothetical protein COMA2_120084 [Candidatus Nitrospira nitrificans]|uniref:Uncharacterized protein n=1 Tax=Candidatus Nitrospira nitrificans TaxID=1742973 RepID=A0A0S4L643_9BACT|nr:hypothetical protein COMA2_120084 [Candidatus Nitrospira nitrificans]